MSRCLVQNGRMTDDEILLEDVAIAGPRGRSPNSPDERDQFIRLMDGGYLRRVPSSDPNDPLFCTITNRGRQRLDEIIRLRRPLD